MTSALTFIMGFVLSFVLRKACVDSDEWEYWAIFGCYIVMYIIGAIAGRGLI